MTSQAPVAHWLSQARRCGILSLTVRSVGRDGVSCRPEVLKLWKRPKLFRVPEPIRAKSTPFKAHVCFREMYLCLMTNGDHCGPKLL